MEVLRVLFRVNRRAGPIGGGAFPPSDRRQAGAAGGRRGGPRPCRGLWRRDRLPSPAVFVRRNETVSVVPLRLHALGDDEGVHRYGALAGGADEEGVHVDALQRAGVGGGVDGEARQGLGQRLHVGLGAAAGAVEEGEALHRADHLTRNVDAEGGDAEGYVLHDLDEDAAEAEHHDGAEDRIARDAHDGLRSEEQTSELKSIMRISYAVFCLKRKSITTTIQVRNSNNT